MPCDHAGLEIGVCQAIFLEEKGEGECGKEVKAK